MIAKGIQHNNGGRLAAYLIKGKDGEVAELAELRGFACQDIKDAFRSVHVMAEATRAEQPFFHVQVRLPEDDKLTREQWQQTANRIERMLGLNDQPRAIAFHIDKKTGEEHMHVAWSRIDTENMKAIPLPFFKERLKKISRELELHFGITQVTSQRDSEIKYAPTKAEAEQARRLGTDIHQIRETIRECYTHSDCGRAFQSALAQEGMILAKGDSRDYLVIYEGGGFLSLGKKLLDVPAAQVRNRLADLDRSQLPALEQAREQMLSQDLAQVQKLLEAEKQSAPIWDRDAANRDWEEAVINAAIKTGNTGGARQEGRTASPLTGTTGLIHDARQHNDTPQAFLAALATHEITLAKATREDAAKSQMDSVEAKIVGSWEPTFQEGEIIAITRHGQAWKLTERTTGDKQFETFIGGLDTSLASIAETLQRQEEQKREREREAQRASQPELNKTAGAIRLAYNLADGPQAFKEMLEQSGLMPARVTAQHIQERDCARKEENRHPAIRAWDQAKAEFLGRKGDTLLNPAPAAPRRLSAHVQEGDVVILDKRGNHYELNKRTTGDTRLEAQAFLAGIGSLPALDQARRQLDEQRRRPIRVPRGPEQAGLVAQQRWALHRVQQNEKQRQEQKRVEEQRRAYQETTKKSAEIDPQRYMSDPDYRREVRLSKEFKTLTERKSERENNLRAMLEQQDRQR